MKALFEFLNQGWVGIVVGLFLFLIGTGLSIHFYRRSRQGAQLAYHYWSTRVLGGKGHKLPELVKITYKGIPIVNLCRSLILVWNNSDKTVRGENITDDDPFCIDVGHDGFVCDATVVKCTRPSNKVRIGEFWGKAGEGERAVIIEFDYLDSGDGFVIEVFHTDTGQPLRLPGSIREMPKPFKNFERYFPAQGFNKFMYYLGSGISLSLVAIGVTYLLVRDFSGDAIFGALLTAGLGAFLWRLTYVGAFKYRRRYPKSLSMPEFHSY